jgi:protein involved in polysaccharide export with SLBB domain
MALAPAWGQEGGEAVTGAVQPPGGAGMVGPGEGLEAAISGASYRLGPGDGLTIGIWGPQPIRLDLAVNLEGKLLIPAVGELSLDGLLLDEARDRIRRAVLSVYHNIEVTVSLTRLRRFQVHVLGQVERPGTYVGTAVDRASAAVGWAGGLQERASQRRITLVRGDSIRARADLFIFLRRGQSGSNPWLRDGDIVYVPFARDRFSVRGAVNDPGDFEYLEGDRFSDAISFAGGLTPQAYRDTIEIARYLSSNSWPVRFFAVAGGELLPARPQGADLIPQVLGQFTVEHAEPDMERTLYPDFLLRSDDIIFIRSVPEYRQKKLVEVQGEVVYPGIYAIAEGETRLSDVIRRAGGITPEAFLREAQLNRREAIRLEDREFERLKAIPAADMNEDEYEYFKLRSRENPGLMVVDFHRLIAEGDASQDVLLRRGDLIAIPTRRDFISVLGLVGSPGNILYTAGFRPMDYIRMAGGFAEKADRGKTRVIRAAGGEWVSIEDADSLGPGDTIWIPERQPSQFWGTFKDVLAVTTQILTIYLIADTAIN